MTFQEIVEKVKTNEITLNLHGHKTHHNLKQLLIKDYEETIQLSLGKNDNKWSQRPNKSVEEINEEMRKFFKAKLNCEVEETKEISTWSFESQECIGCGEKLSFILNNNSLDLQFYYDHNKNDFTQFPADYICLYAIPKPFKGKINVSSKMIFANFFTHIEDEPEGKKYTQDYSLSTLKGRENITKFKESNNIAYGQMSNTSIGIFLHPNKKSIIIGNPYIADEILDKMSDKEYKEYKKTNKKLPSIIEKHKLIGNISLEVWRWECTDIKTLDKNYNKIIQDFKKRNINVVEVNTEHGTWEFEHYFDTQTNPNKNIYAKLTKST